MSPAPRLARLVLAACLLLPAALPAQAPDTPPGPQLWLQVLRELHQYQRETARLDRQREPLLAELERLRHEDTEPQDLSLTQRATLRSLLAELHDIEEQDRAAEQRLRQTADELVRQADTLTRQLQQARNYLESRDDGKGPPSKFRDKRREDMQRQIERMQSLLDSLSGDHETDTQRVFETLAEAGNAPLPGQRHLARRFIEKIEELEREQAFLQRRLEANTRELQALRRQFEQLLGRTGIQPGELQAPPAPKAEDENQPPSALQERQP